MKISSNYLFYLCIFVCLSSNALFAQNSILINFGSATCSNSSAPGFSIIKNPLSGTPLILSQCSMASQVPDFYSVFIAYNPKDNKLYVADVRTGVASKIWKLDVGLPQKISCPDIIPVAPTYTHGYVSNNFEFDNNGDLWSLSAYNVGTGQCRMDKFDVVTGSVINTRILQFPVGNFPNTILSGDLTILPNGRMFATLGNSPSKLYEVKDYSSTSGNASATYLQTMPKNCYGIAYLNGELEITGSNLVNECYYYRYGIASNTLNSEQPFQNGQAPIDNTSISPSLGATKELVSAVGVNANTADITYEIYVRNMGNVVLNDINVTEDLGAVFGAANVSNVSTSFVPGFNGAGLTLNPAYNGKTETSLLNTSQNLTNQTATNSDYYFMISVQCRVTNIDPGKVYLNSAIGKATINTAVEKINISDSSNNGSDAMVDPNNDGNSSGVNENVPTPFSMSVLPVHFLDINALPSNGNVMLSWQVATPMSNAKLFLPEFSKDGRNWEPLSVVNITDANRANYVFTHQNVPDGPLYYRVRQQDNDGGMVVSKTVVIRSQLAGSKYRVFPNPANQQVTVTTNSNAGLTDIALIDASGKILEVKQLNGGSLHFNTGLLPNGIYYLRISGNGETAIQKITIIH